MGIIEFKDVSFQYPNGFSAVENVSFEINEGEAIAIIGQNGAGKTTTVKMINGLLKPTHGTVLIDGMDTKDYTTAQLSKIAGYVFQNPDDQIFHNNVEDEIRFGPKKQGLSEEEIVNIINQVFEEVNPSGIKDMGKVMGIVTPKVKGKADMSVVSALIRNKLN